MSSISKFKDSFSDNSGIVYLNNAGFSPICRQAKESLQEVTNKFYDASTVVLMELFAKYNADVRKNVARLIGAEADEVSFFHTCATAISQAALGIKLSKGDEILSWDQEYPSNAYPWNVAAKRQGAVLKTLSSGPDYSVSTDRLLESINSRTKVIAVSWVQYQSGAITDLKRLSDACRKNNTILVVDAIQGLGVMPFNMHELGVDIVCGGSHKWNCGPLGLGYLAVRRELIPELEPIYYGAMSYLLPNEKTDLTKDLKNSQARFEPGAPFLLTGLATSAAIELILECGVENLHKEALRISDLIIAGMSERGFQPLGDWKNTQRSPITTFQIKNNKRLAEILSSKGVLCAGERADGLRLAPHAFVRDESIEKFFKILDECLKEI
jgi:cysteine desulfurase/selenocysteine lyase